MIIVLIHEKCMNKKQGTRVMIAEAGAGLAALAGAVAAGVFLYGPNGAKRRKVIRGWALKLKGEVVDQLEQLQELNEKVYHGVVDDITRRYRALPRVDIKELDALAKELKRHWRHINTSLVKKQVRRKKSA